MKCSRCGEEEAVADLGLNCLEEYRVNKQTHDAENDRLRAELEATRQNYDSAAMQAAERMSQECQLLRTELERTEFACLEWMNCTNNLRAELAKAQEELFKGQDAVACRLCDRDRLAVRIKELELSLSEQYVKGMEEAARIAESERISHRYVSSLTRSSYNIACRDVHRAILFRIAEIQKESAPQA